MGGRGKFLILVLITITTWLFLLIFNRPLSKMEYKIGEHNSTFGPRKPNARVHWEEPRSCEQLYAA